MSRCKVDLNMITSEKTTDSIHKDILVFDWSSMAPRAAFAKIDEIVTTAYEQKDNLGLASLPERLFSADALADERDPVYTEAEKNEEKQRPH